MRGMSQKGTENVPMVLRDPVTRGQRCDPVFGNQQVTVIFTRKSNVEMGNLVGMV